MKYLVMAAILVFSFTGEAVAASKIGAGASINLPVKARIINLTHIPLSEAIAFCDEHAMACPALREQHEEDRRREIAAGRGSGTVFSQFENGAVVME